MKRSLLTLALTLGVLITTAAAPEAPALRHFQLRGSAPEADAVLGAPPAEVRLWFSQEPQDGSMSIRLVDPTGDVHETGDVVQDVEDGKIFTVAIADRLAPATYTVAWRALGQDGHVVRGDFAFTVAD